MDNEISTVPESETIRRGKAWLDSLLFQWVPVSERLPEPMQSVVLANVNRMRSFDAHGCVKDVGVLVTDFGTPHWSTQGESRALMLKAFTHWMPLFDPPRASDSAATSLEGK